MTKDHDWSEQLAAEREQNIRLSTRIAELTRERDAARAEVTRSDEVVIHMTHCRECAEGPTCQEVLGRVDDIRVRVGLKPSSAHGR